MMSEPKSIPSSPRKRRWPKRLLWIFLGLCVILGPIVGKHFYDRWQADRELQEAIAELDAADPDWTLERIEAKRRVVPEEENSAPIIVAAKKAFPAGGWSNDLDEITKNPSPCLLATAHEARLRAALQPLAKALGQARTLVGFPNGRYALVHAPDFISTLPVRQEAREIGFLLHLDMLLLLQEGKATEARDSFRALLNVARSLGDEPLAISQLIRIAMTTTAVECLERLLAQGQLSAAHLAEAEKSLGAEADENWFLTSMMGERAGSHQALSYVEAGHGKFGNLAGGDGGVSGLPASFSEYLAMVKVKRSHAWLLRFQTRIIEAAKLPDARRYPALKTLDDELSRLDRDARENQDISIGPLLMPAVMKIAQAEQRTDTRLRCAGAALAAERFRLQHQRWPASLDELVKEKFLSEVPIDLFDSQPLRFRPMADGLVIYSIGRDRAYDGTALDDLHNYNPNNQRVEFRLWNPDRRRQPPLPPRVKANN